MGKMFWAFLTLLVCGVILSFTRSPAPRRGILTEKGWSCETILQRERLDLTITMQPLTQVFLPYTEEIGRLSASSPAGPVQCPPLERELKPDEQLLKVETSFIVLRDDTGTLWKQVFFSQEDAEPYVPGDRYDIGSSAFISPR